MTMPPIILADDHPLFRAALTQAVQQFLDGGNIIGVDSIAALLTTLDQHPDVELVFLDLHMPDNHGFSGLTKLKNHFPDVTVIMVSSENDPDIMRRAINFGAAAFIPKAAELEVIGAAIQSVLEGETWLPNDVGPDINRHLAEQQRNLANQLSQLTPQQYTVLTMIADGKLNKQIAYELDIQETTVKKHVSAILTKLNVNNRTLAGIAFQQVYDQRVH